jgi:hypothetical protein
MKGWVGQAIGLLAEDHVRCVNENTIADANRLPTSEWSNPRRPAERFHPMLMSALSSVRASLLPS